MSSSAYHSPRKLMDHNNAYLLYQIARAMFFSKDKNALLGMFWHVLHPLLLSVVLLVVFTYKFNTRIENFGFYILLGLMHFNLFSTITSEATVAMVAYRSMVLSSTIPKEILVFALAINALVTFLSEVAVFLIFMLIMHIPIKISIVLYPLVILSELMLAVGVGLFLAVFSVFFRDIAYLWNVFLRMLFFFLPIFYVLDPIGHHWFNDFLRFNPLAQILILSRECVLYGHIPDLSNLTILMAIAVSIFWISLQYFRSREPYLADKM